MKSHNLSLLSTEERRSIELQRQAALLIHNMKKGRVTREKVNSEVNNLDSSEQDEFKGFLNKFKSMR